jgi:hypothetical protein
MFGNLVYNVDGVSGFVDKLRDGTFDKKLFKKVLVEIKGLLDEIRKANNINNKDVADLCNLMFDIRSFANDTDVEVLEAEASLLNLIESLYD